MLLRHTVLYLPAQLLGPAIQFVSIILWAYLLPPAGVGVVTLVIAIQEVSFVLFFMWWSHYALRFISRYAQDAPRRRFLASEFAAILFGCSVQAAFVVPALLFMFPGDMRPVALAATILFVLTRSLNNYLSERARSEVRIGLYTFIQTAGSFFGLAIGIVLLNSVSRTPTSVFAGFAIAQGLTAVVAAFWSDFGRVFPRFDREILSEAAKFGIPVMAAQLLALIAINAPRFVVESAMGLAAAGLFSVGYGLGLRVSSVAVMLVTAGAYPLVVRKMEFEGVAAAYRQLAKNITLVALAVAPAAFGLLAVNGSLVDIVVPVDYREATVQVLPLAAIGGLLRYLRAHTTDQVFLLRSRTLHTTGIAAADLLLAVLGARLGLLFGGIAGAAAGPMISGFATFAASLVIAQIRMGFRLPARALIGVFLAAGLMAVIVHFAPAGPGLLGLAWRFLLGIVTYSSGVIALLPAARQAALSATMKFYGGRVAAIGRRLR
jgi:O-antigen/teichoic acid export membrane protein